MDDSHFDFDRSAEPPLRIRSLQGAGAHALPEHIRDRIVVYTPHDGGALPRRYRYRPDGTPLIPPAELERKYIEARDWGANAVAKHLATELGLRSYATVEVARVLLDFNRFPGGTPVDEDDPLECRAIGSIYDKVLDHDEKMELLETYYDQVSERIEGVFDGSLIAIAIHTYDEINASKTKRADLSLISLPLSYQRESRLTYGVFDPLFPDHLAESTCSRILRDRVSLNLERDGFRVTHNHPYPMPDGSIELRAQVWHFFRALQRGFLTAYPETEGVPAYDAIWMMLLDTNLRLAEAEALRSFLHRYRRVAQHDKSQRDAALAAYRHIRRYLAESDVVTNYRRGSERPSSLGIEVRKDLLCTVDPETGLPRRPDASQRETAQRIARAIAGAIRTYIDTDRPVYVQRSLTRPPPPPEPPSAD